MTLEEKLRALATKGELVHLSIAFIGNEYRASFSTASAASSYAFGADADPVSAIEKAFKATPVKIRYPSALPAKMRAPDEVTAAVNDEVKPERDGALNSEWTTP